jgi:hypothetical protein
MNYLILNCLPVDAPDNGSDMLIDNTVSAGSII